jgi:hypothetical protein
LNVEVGFVEKRPTDKSFRIELEAEIQRMQLFLNRQSATLTFAK